jgi:hypothetical protein
MSKLNFTFLFLLFFTSHAVFSQRDDIGNYEYDKEYLFGINKNTNGGLIGGISFKIGTRIDDSQFAFWGVELSNVKNQKEARYNFREIKLPVRDPSSLWQRNYSI